MEVTTPMLEKAARAHWERRREDWRGQAMNTVEWESLSPHFKAEQIAATRAALEALRDPDGATFHAAFVAMNETPSGTWKRLKAENLTPKELFVAKMVPRWRAMIDHILKGVE